MEKQIIAFFETLKTNKKLSSFDKASTKQAIVIRLLSLLGWDIFNVDEVKPDHAVKSSLIDFALRSSNIDAYFIGVEKVGADLTQSQKDLLGSALNEGVKLAALTDGVIWWFYLSFSEGSFDQKRFYSLDLLKKTPKETAARIIELLEKENVTKGKALKIAESIQTKRQRKLIQKSMVKAWNRIITEPHKTLVSLFSETVEKLCGYKPDKEMVAEFLAELGQTGTVQEETEQKKSSFPNPSTYKGRVITAFTFAEDSFKVEAWDEFLTKLCELLISKHNQDIARLLWHSVGNKYYFREDPDELRLPVMIEGTNIFVESHLSPEDTVKIAHSILSAFGFSGDDLEIKSKKK
jgi:predicted type IV restriction endonuclease